MSDQLSIFDGFTAGAEDELEPLTIGERFERFHRTNPHVLDALVGLSRQLVRRGHRRLGMKMLFEVLRWQSMLQTTDTDGEGFKLCNSYTAHYARLVMRVCPDLDGVFNVRPLRSE